MSIIGLRLAVAAKIQDYTPGSPITYTGGKVIAKAIAANVTWNRIDNPLYADDEIAENDNGITGGQISVNIDDLADEDAATLFGLVKNADTDEYTETDAAAPYVGYGYIRVKVKGGAKSYQAMWIHRTQFGMNSENSQTKGQQITWQTPELVGEIMGAQIDNTGATSYRTRYTAATYEAAKTWLFGKAGITEGA